MWAKIINQLERKQSVLWSTGFLSFLRHFILVNMSENSAT